jgi:phage terminase small subunit
MPTPTKTIAAHQHDGTWRKERHASQADLTASPGAPTKPNDLPPDGARLWDEIISCLPAEVLSRCDIAAMEGVCFFYALMRQAFLDGDVNAAVVASRRVEVFMARLGLSPADRAKLRQPPKEELDELDQLRLLRADGGYGQ